MAIATSPESSSAPGPQDGIAWWRLLLLRAGYLLIVAGMGMQIVPAFLHHGPWTLSLGVMNSMLLALVMLCALGLLYPLKMLPVLFWELAWKAIWLLAVALPAWQGDKMDADMRDTVFACALAAIFLFAIPWDYVRRSFANAPARR